MNDYEIEINDVENGVYTGEMINLGGGDYCGVHFDGVGSPDLRESTFDVSGGDGSQFGIEFYGSINWNITGVIHGSPNKNIPGDPSIAWDAWSRLSRAWVEYPGRTTTRAVVPLYFKRPGREQMVVYGRPRRIDPETGLSYSGKIAYTALFKQNDIKFYSATETTLLLDIAPTTGGGLLLDVPMEELLLPFQTSTPATTTDLVNNLGDIATNPVISFTGPVTNPIFALATDDGILWMLKLETTIPAGLVVTIDTRIWERTIKSEDGASFAGFYVGNKLQDIVIPPGEYEVSYSGIDETGTSTCTIKYRNAWSST